jgi:hypothetical protein
LINSGVLKRQLLLMISFCSPVIMFSQVVYQDLTNTAIYEFLDEMAGLQLISLNSTIKPYPREYIAEKLKEVDSKESMLNKRQRKELAFYLRDYNLEIQPDLAYSKKVPGFFRKKDQFGIPFSPLSFIYKDSLFTFSLRPVWGIRYFTNENGSVYHSWGGAEIFGYIGKHFGFYANLRDNHESEMLVSPVYFTQDEGASWKGSPKGGGDYSEMRGGVTYSWKWGSVAFVKDHFQWGNQYNGSTIFSGRTPSFPYVQLTMTPAKWFSFNYLHGWMVSQVIDSSRSWQFTNGTRQYYFNKFIAASMLTFNPWERLSLSAGNSVVYCAGYPNPAFLSPFLFFTNFSYSGNEFQKAYYGNNSQLFFDVSSRQIKHLHLYGSLFFDGFSWDVFTNSTMTNFISYKGGLQVSDLPLQNLFFTAEYSMTNPMTYKSPVSTLTFSSSNYSLGHWLRDNSQDIFFCLGYKPLRCLRVNVSYEMSQHGTDVSYSEVADPNSVPVLTGLTWQANTFGISAKYEFINNAYLTMEYANRSTTGDLKYSPPEFQGNTNTFVAGFNIGF